MNRLREELDAINDQRVIPLSMRDYRAKISADIAEEAERLCVPGFATPTWKRVYGGGK